MSTTSLEGGSWRPDSAQERLLRAALLPDPPDAVAAFAEWQHLAGAVDDFEGLDQASFRLLPLVWRNAGAALADHPLASQLRSVYRRTWFDNRLLVRAAHPVYTALEAAGIPHLTLKGAALGVLHYRDNGARPMHDLDVLVPIERTGEAVDVLLGLGWRAERDAVDVAREVQLTHSLGFTGPGASTDDEGRVDLHWRPLYDGFHLGCDKAMWARSVPLDLDGVATRALDPTDQFAHACLHGVRWNAVSPIRWVADAVVVARGSSLDWERMRAEADARGLAAELATAVGFLDGRFGVEVPAEARAALAQVRTTPYRRFARWARTAPPSRRATAAQVLVVQFADRTRGLAAAQRVRAYPGYLKDAFGQASLGGVARRVASAAQGRAHAS